MSKFSTIINIQKQHSPNEIIVRKTKYKLRLIILLTILTSLSLLIFIVGFQSVIGELPKNIEYLVAYSSGGIGIAILIPLMILSAKMLVNYFYDLVIITPESIIIIHYKLFFSESIQIIELYRIQTLTSEQNGIAATLCNYGNITMSIQNMEDTTIRYIPQPQKVVVKIEELKEHSTNERYSSNDEDQDTIEKT